MSNAATMNVPSAVYVIALRFERDGVTRRGADPSLDEKQKARLDARLASIDAEIARVEPAKSTK